MTRTTERLALAAMLALLSLVLGGAVCGPRQAAEPVWAPHSAVAWPLLPVSVWISPSLGDAHVESAATAMRAINDAAGCTLLRRAPTRERSQIEIESGGCDAPAHAGCAAFDAFAQRATLRIAHPGQVTQSYLIAQHELGHALGLADDGVYDAPQEPAEWRWMRPFVSVMATNVAEHANRLEAGHLLPVLTSADAAALAARYCPQETP